MGTSELDARPRWQATGNSRFPAAALVEGRWWVLRMNCFPDHALWTLFIDGVVRFDIDDVPAGWGQPLDRLAPVLESDVAQGVLGPVERLVAYGSEVGQPCEDPFCCG